MNILQEIVAHKYLEVEERRSTVGLDALKNIPRSVPLLDLKTTLAKDGIQVIAEMKRKSPSVGDIFQEADPVAVAVDYEKHGAAAISVLTDQKYFGGSLDFLKQIKVTVSIPVLQKDFIISEYQVYESYAAGADSILLIVEAMEIEQLKDLYFLALELGMSVLVEFHGKENLAIIQALAAEILGVNARNLETMATDIHWFGKVFEDLPQGAIKVAESGIHTSDNLEYVQDLGYDAALIGTALMKNGTPGKTLAELLRGNLK